MSRVVVIGAGIGGLSAAARLAARGHTVTVVEAAAHVGGKLGAREHVTSAGTFRFDTGPSLLTMPYVFEELFAATGSTLSEAVTLRRVDPIARYRLADGGTLDTTSALDEQCERFDHAFGPPAGAQWRALYERGRRVWSAVEKPLFGGPFDVLAALRRLGALPAVAPGRTLAGLARSFDHPDARRVVWRYATYAGSDPRRAPAALSVIPFLEQAFGAWHVEGGLARLGVALADRLSDRGGRLLLGQRVVRIETAGSRATGVVTADGTRLPADAVVADLDDPRQLIRPTRASRRSDSLSGFVLMLGVRAGASYLSHHSVLFGSEPYEDEFDAIFGRPGREATDPTVYVSAPGDPLMQPAGFETWFVLVNAARHGIDGGRGELDWTTPGRAQSYADHLLDVLAARGLDVRPRLEFCLIRSPAELERDTLAPGGAIYGPARHGAIRSLSRSRNATRIGGLFRVGGSAHPGGGLPLVALSGRIVAELIGPA